VGTLKSVNRIYEDDIPLNPKPLAKEKILAD
jgi:hypothetical protein